MMEGTISSKDQVQFFGALSIKELMDCWCTFLLVFRLKKMKPYVLKIWYIYSTNNKAKLCSLGYGSWHRVALYQYHVQCTMYMTCVTSAETLVPRLLTVTCSEADLIVSCIMIVLCIMNMACVTSAEVLVPRMHIAHTVTRSEAGLIAEPVSYQDWVVSPKLWDCNCTTQILIM